MEWGGSWEAQQQVAARHRQALAVQMNSRFQAGIVLLLSLTESAH